MKIAIIGSGSWGTALALSAYRAKNDVVIWSRNQSTAAEINQYHTNSHYLANIQLPNDIIATNNLAETLKSDLLLLSIPAQNIRQLCEDLVKLNLSKEIILVICSKGIEQESLKLMSEVIKEILPNNKTAFLSGPNFAHEVAQNLPAIASLASKDSNIARIIASNLTSSNFRIYPNSDPIGTQIMGAAKNVLAIATGISIGKNLGENAKAAILSRGIIEINSLSLAKGGDSQTLLAPAGIGDIHLTCSSATSRNTSYGIALAQNQPKAQVLAEGFYSAKSIHLLAKSLNIEMPICKAVYQIVHQNQSIDTIITELLYRSIKD
jgi:glycerol-3-phosphate dehydrogenase (NAD(P)+)